MNPHAESGVKTDAPSLPEMIFAHTDGGEEIVARMVEFMHGQVEGARAADQLAAARELMDRAWGKPAASAQSAMSDDTDDDRPDDAARKLSEMIAAALAADDDRSSP